VGERTAWENFYTAHYARICELTHKHISLALRAALARSIAHRAARAPAGSMANVRQHQRRASTAPHREVIDIK